MNINIQISDEMEAQIITDSLYESIEMMYDDLIWLANLEHRSAHQDADLVDHLVSLESLKEVYKYYSVSEKWSKLDKFNLVKTEMVVVDTCYPEEECDEGTESTVPFEAPMFVHGEVTVEDDEPADSLHIDPSKL